MEILFYFLIIIIIVSVPLSLYFFRNPNKNESLKDLYAEGLDMLVMGRRKVAYKNFKSIIEKDSGNIKAYLYLGQVIREGGNPKKALKIHKNLLHREDINSYDRIQLYKNISLDYYDILDNENSINNAKLILDIESYNEWALKHLIKLYKKSNEWSNAIEYLKMLFKIKNITDNEKVALYCIQVGRMHLKNNNFDLARNMFEESMQLEPSLHIGYYFIGNSFAEESNVIYDNSVELDEDFNDSLEKNEESQKMKLEAENFLSKAITMWGYFIEYMPEYSWMILPTLKDALQALHRYDDIEKFLIQANENYNKNNVDILSHLADFYANKGEIDKALKTINSVLEGNKDSLLARLKKMKINLLQNKENSLSVEVDKLIVSLQRDKRFIKYKQSYNDKNMRWLFETNNIS